MSENKSSLRSKILNVELTLAVFLCHMNTEHCQSSHFSAVGIKGVIRGFTQ